MWLGRRQLFTTQLEVVGMTRSAWMRDFFECVIVIVIVTTILLVND